MAQRVYGEFLVRIKRFRSWEDRTQFEVLSPLPDILAVISRRGDVQWPGVSVKFQEGNQEGKKNP